ncbi:abscisic acid and environmental stress-inducible protein isoform X3 [Jatropha curcas]|uniref:abscisic acid and environmental stress-inducible protein isoform X3 n=1 Tax=Jatropha curcas TaxID=180498 RepID=UPI0005FBED69|nr:abscisic acid and environmental stress-inducible protein isoform X3 [Jatropha curcas]
MGLKKLGFPLLAIMVILSQLHLLLPPLHAHPLQNASTAKGIKQLLSVDRRGGGGGGHGGGGHGGGHASHSAGSHAHSGEATGNGNDGYVHGATVVPLLSAGAMSHHQNNDHHHGANGATPTSTGPSYVVLAALVSFIQYFALL